jgi:hypothetical protein
LAAFLADGAFLATFLAAAFFLATVTPPSRFLATGLPIDDFDHRRHSISCPREVKFYLSLKSLQALIDIFFKNCGEKIPQREKKSFRRVAHHGLRPL